MAVEPQKPFKCSRNRASCIFHGKTSIDPGTIDCLSIVFALFDVQSNYGRLFCSKESFAQGVPRDYECGLEIVEFFIQKMSLLLKKYGMQAL
jgi:hypothetical protein